MLISASMWMRVTSFVLFYASWLGSIRAAQTAYPALLSFAALLPLFLFTILLRRNRARSVVLILLVSFLGVAVDSTLFGLQFYSFSPASELPWPIVPLWLIPLWMGFACSLLDLGPMFSSKLLLGATLGSVSGPLSYAAGEKMGVVKIEGSIFVLAALWFVLFPVMVKIVDSFQKSSPDKAQS